MFNLDDLKKTLKPLIKQCIRELLFEETGVLSKIISETVRGLQGTVVLTETKAPAPVVEQNFAATTKEKKVNLSEQRKMLLDSIGKDSFKGVDIFAGVEPLVEVSPPVAETSSPSAPKTALSGIAPNDPGINIDGILNVAGGTGTWNKVLDAMKGKR